MAGERGVWTEFFRVRSYEVDPSGHVPIATLCNYLQEASGNHARALGFAAEVMLERGLAWVLGRLHLEIERYPEWGDVVTVETWHSGVHRLFTTREFVLRDGGGCQIGRGTSAWLIIDVDRRRIVRPPTDLLAVEPSERGRALVDAFDAAPDAPETPDYENVLNVRASDLDFNQHVNNARYAEWAVEALPASVRDGYCLSELEVQFRAESTLGDTIVTQAQRDDLPTGVGFNHHLRRTDDDRVLARLRTRWTPQTTSTRLYAMPTQITNG